MSCPDCGGWCRNNSPSDGDYEVRDLQERVACLEAQVRGLRKMLERLGLGVPTQEDLDRE